METELYIGILAVHTYAGFKVETAVAMTEEELLDKIIAVICDTCGLPVPPDSSQDDIEDKRAILNGLVLRYNRIDSTNRACIEMLVISVVDGEIADTQLLGASP